MKKINKIKFCVLCVLCMVNIGAFAFIFDLVDIGTEGVKFGLSLASLVGGSTPKIYVVNGTDKQCVVSYPVKSVGDKCVMDTAGESQSSILGPEAISRACAVVSTMGRDSTIIPAKSYMSFFYTNAGELRHNCGSGVRTTQSILIARCYPVIVLVKKLNGHIDIDTFNDQGVAAGVLNAQGAKKYAIPESYRAEYKWIFTVKQEGDFCIATPKENFEFD